MTLIVRLIGVMSLLGLLASACATTETSSPKSNFPGYRSDYTVMKAKLPEEYKRGYRRGCEVAQQEIRAVDAPGSTIRDEKE